jgi:hypothetical protein
MSQEERSQPMNMTKFKKYLPMIAGILIAIPLAIGAFFLTQGALTRAGSVSPVDILVTKITDSSATKAPAKAWPTGWRRFNGSLPGCPKASCAPRRKPRATAR